MMNEKEIEELRDLIGKKNLYEKERILYLLKKWNGELDKGLIKDGEK